MTSTPTFDINVFISYSHEGKAHEDKVLAFADRLRNDEGINATIDQYVPAPPEGWPQWMASQIRQADFVLMVCTPTYYQRVVREQKPGTGLGVTWEAQFIYQQLYNVGGVSNKFIPILFEEGKEADIPDAVQGKTRYRVTVPDEYDGLCRLLTNQPATPPVPLGTRRVLPPNPRNP